jgi:hypothetical protein
MFRVIVEAAHGDYAELSHIVTIESNVRTTAYPDLRRIPSYKLAITESWRGVERGYDGEKLARVRKALSS